jgi:predicted ribosome quality control (RQC) complex YloA/Tae2 family protein
LVNMLWRDQRDVMETLFDLSQELGDAQSGASGDLLRELTAQRRALESALVQRARGIAEKEGVNVTPEMERDVQETLAAALAQPEMADEVRTGRLVKPLEYAGFGTFPTTTTAATPKREGAAKEPTPIRKPQDDERAKKLREQAERRLQEARDAADDAARDLAEVTRAAESAQQRTRELNQQLEQLQRQVREMERDIAAAERAEREAKRRWEQAQQENEAAQKRVKEAEAGLKS